MGEGHEDVRDALRVQAPDVGRLRRRRARDRGRGAADAVRRDRRRRRAPSTTPSRRLERAAPAGPTGYAGEGAEREFEVAEEGRDGSVRVAVVVQRLGEAVWPVDVELRFEGGATSGRARGPEPSAGSATAATGPKLVSAEVDPDRKCLLDANPLNNGRLTEPDPPRRARGRRASASGRRTLSSSSPSSASRRLREARLGPRPRDARRSSRRSRRGRRSSSSSS